MEKSRFTVNQSIPEEYKPLYIRILLIFSEVGIDMLNDCGAVHQLGNKNVIDCYLMFNTAISAYHTGDKKACQLLMNYIDKQLDITYKDLDIDVDIDEGGDDDNELTKYDKIPLDKTVIVHKGLSHNPIIGNKYVFSGVVHYGVDTLYDIFKQETFSERRIETYGYLVHINALIVATAITNNKDGEFSTSDCYKYDVYVKGENLYYTTDKSHKQIITIPNNVTVHYNTTFTSATASPNFYIENNKILCLARYTDSIVIRRKQSNNKRNYDNHIKKHNLRKKGFVSGEVSNYSLQTINGILKLTGKHLGGKPYSITPYKQYCVNMFYVYKGYISIYKYTINTKKRNMIKLTGLDYSKKKSKYFVNRNEDCVSRIDKVIAWL